LYYEVKSKLSSTLLQLAVHFFNETKRTARKFEGLEKKRRIIRTVCVNSTGYLLQLCKIGIFESIFFLLCIQAVSDVGPYQTIC